ncbi:MAG: hypothetical protein D6730_25365 [Bacteroidetes bacterium]|nr:MAG: hypothetical protein D6730_25365 [Bacteroidota bacterium]
MSIRVIPKTAQAKGQFNGGAILENKPIGFPGEGGQIRPYSNLFYWAHAWSDQGSTIGEHPHRGFEIMSFVLKGSIDHYDSKYKAWKPLKAGDAQVIRSGNGISHAERLNAGAHIFQIWVDPNLNQSLQKEASYDDYPAESFPETIENGMRIKHYHGNGASMNLDAEGLEIQEIQLQPGTHQLSLAPDKVHSFYLISGALSLNNHSLQQDDFALVKNEATLEIKADTASRLFRISAPLQPSYLTYAQMQGMRA